MKRNLSFLFLLINGIAVTFVGKNVDISSLEQSFEKENNPINFLNYKNDVDVEVPRTEFNIVSKDLNTGATNFINFDQDFYEYRQYAYDTPETRSELDERNINIEVKTVDRIGFDVQYTKGYCPLLSNGSDSNNRDLFDERTDVTDTTIWPYRATGYVRARFDVINNNTGLTSYRYTGGTGFLEGPDLMVTAGHVIFNDQTSSYYDENNILHEEFDDYLDNPKLADEIIFYPAKNENYLPYGSVLAERVYIEKRLYLGQGGDWGCCKLSSPIGYTTGWYGKMSNFYIEDYDFDTYGYPGDFNGKMCKAPAHLKDYENDTGVYRTDLFTSGGHSGGPYQAVIDDEGYVIGIHTYGVGNLYSGGPMINSFMFAFMNSFVAASHTKKTIIPTDYGFSDSYMTGIYYQQNYVNSYASGFTFMTRRFRTGYIHNEYIVMSPIKTGITRAYLEYRFTIPVNRIDVELAYWRSPSLELLTPSTGLAELQLPASSDIWIEEVDLLSDISMPTDRTHPTLFTFIFDEPVFRFRFYSEIFSPMTSDSNRGRICIGDMTIWSPNNSGYLPMNGSEDFFDTYIWDYDIQSSAHSYGYAIDNQVHPGTNVLYEDQQPGSYAQVGCYPYTKQNIVNAVQADFAKYNQDFNTNKIFQEVSKDTVCQAGTYKVALATSATGYYWYRQNADGYWSHKPNNMPITMYDESNNLIIDPEKADRGYYTNFLGYFAVSPWRNYYV